MPMPIARHDLERLIGADAQLVEVLPDTSTSRSTCPAPSTCRCASSPPTAPASSTWAAPWSCTAGTRCET